MEADECARADRLATLRRCDKRPGSAMDRRSRGGDNPFTIILTTVALIAINNYDPIEPEQSRANSAKQ
jgi:hypothetical protein